MTFPGMRLSFAAAVFAATGLAGPPPSPPPAPSLSSTPVGRRAAAYFEAFNSGSEENMRRFFEENATADSLKERPAAARLEIYRRMKKANGHLRLDRVLESEPTRVAVLAENDAHEWRRFEFEASGGDGRLLGISVDDADPPGSGPPGAAVQRRSTDAEAARAADAWISERAARGEFSGVVLLARGGKSFFEKAWGLADRERKIPNTIATKFNLGSINKTFTQVAIAQLAAAGKLSLTDTIRRWLPDYRAAYADRVTIGQLLDMTSGMGDIFGSKFDVARAGLRRLEDYRPLFEDDPLKFEPGKGNEYSNAGYVVLGLVVEAASGEDYYRYVHDHVFAPAGMQNTASWALDESVPDRAIGYALGPDGYARPNSDSLPARGSSAGGGYSTAEDLLRFDAALRGGRLLPPAWTAWMFGDKGAAPAPGTPLPVRGAVAIAGGSPGVNAALELNLESGTTVVVLVNRDPPAAVRAARTLAGYLPAAE